MIAVSIHCIQSQQTPNLAAAATLATQGPQRCGQSRALAKRTADQTDPAARIESLYRIALARVPDEVELQTATAFVTTDPSDASEIKESKVVDPWTQLSQVLLLCNEFAFVD